MRITVAHSPDSDDAFMFYGLARGLVPTDGLEVEHVLCDIETLNRAAFEGRYEVSAVSFNAYAHLTWVARRSEKSPASFARASPSGSPTALPRLITRCSTAAGSIATAPIGSSACT